MTFQKILLNYKEFFTKERKKSFLVGLLILGLAIVFQSYAIAYSVTVPSNFVQDMFLDNIPVINLDAVTIEGAFIMIIGTIILISAKPRYLIFTIKAAAIFITTRAIFVSVTHLGVYPGEIVPDFGYLDRLYTTLGLHAGHFFSGHTGLTFLMALIFWHEKLLRYMYLTVSIVFGLSVLLTHVHYSIDVLAAPFMTYSIFKISQYLFEKDFELIENKV